MGRKTVIGDEAALALRKQWENEVLPRAEEDWETYNLLRDVFRCVSERRPGDVIVNPAAEKKRDLAEEERKWWEIWYRKLGFAVQKPAASNREFARWQKSPSGLIFVPSATREFYEQFMRAVGQGNHWTVADADREGIVWDDAQSADGYWLKVDLASDCPRLGTPWDILQKEVRLLTLPEYAIAWHAVLARTGQMLDVRTWAWLATRYKFSDGQIGALCANEHDGQVRVLRSRPEDLGHSDDFEGGRAAEVVKSAA